MYYAGLDVASKGSFVYVRDRKGRKVEAREIETTRKGLREAFKKYEPVGIIVAVEASGSTRWIYDELTRRGIEVYVVNPNKVKAIGTSKKKTDKIDAKILSELLRIDALPERVYMAQDEGRELRDLMQARYQVVKGYTNLMNYVRGLLRQEGIRLKAKEMKMMKVFVKLLGSRIPGHVREILERYQGTIEAMMEQKEKLEEKIKTYKGKEIELIKTIPGMGEISSRTILSAIGEIKRFKKAKALTSYCGLVPSVYSSGERVVYGHITREGRSEVRRVGIQSAHAVLRSKAVESRPLQEWWEGIADRRGKKTAVVALARKLITIVFYVLRDKKAYDYRLLKVA
jgi:transposase